MYIKCFCTYILNFLAEFIIHLSEKNTTTESFTKALIENGAEFSDSFISNLLRIIQHMKPKKEQSHSEVKSDQKESLAYKFPGLALPNEPQKPLGDDDPKKADLNVEDNDIVSDLMAQFEAEAPSASKIQTKEERKRNR